VSRGRLLLDPRIRPLRPLHGGPRLVGPAVTAWCEPGDIGAALHAVALARAGDVIVIDAGGCLQSAVVGEHLCGAARRSGAAGMVVNGAVRDIGPIAAWPDFPVFTLGNTARGPVSIERGTVGAAIVCGGYPGRAARPHPRRRRRRRRDPARRGRLLARGGASEAAGRGGMGPPAVGRRDDAQGVRPPP
jgi:hypothetical protein